MEQNFLLTEIKNKLGNPSDLKNRRIEFASSYIEIVYMAEITDDSKILDSTIEPLIKTSNTDRKDLLEKVKDQILLNHEVVEITTLEDALDKLLKNMVLIIFDNGQALAVDCENLIHRNIYEPPTSAVLKGPREGFIEHAKINLALIRRRLPTSDFKVDNMKIGKYTKTDVYIMYIDKIADKKVVNLITKKLKSIDIDGIVDSSYLTSFLSERPKSIFKQVGDTEKPDILVAKMLEGRVGILVDGSPIVLTIPFIMYEDIQNSQDYYEKASHASFIRILRFTVIIIFTLLPGTYVALQIYHYKIIPIDFLISIINTTQGIPFTPFSETFFIIVLFEVLYDASLRMPRYLGLALSVVGALVLGETAVNAGLVSPPAVMIVALSGIAFYTMPDQASQLSELRLYFVLAGGVLGLYGILLAVILIYSYFSSFDSYGGCYMAPLTPIITKDRKDFLMKKNTSEMYLRPYSIVSDSKNRRRLKK